MPLKVSDGIGAWIKDFKKSDAPQFKGKNAEERRDMAIAAYLTAKRGPEKENVSHDQAKDAKRNAEAETAAVAWKSSVRESIMWEAVDPKIQRVKMLARSGLVGKSDVNKLMMAMKAIDDGKELNRKHRNIIFDAFNDLIDLVTGDITVFQKAKKAVRKEAVDPSDTGGAEETSMAMKQIKAMRHFLDGIEMRVKSTGDMEEWYQNKLTKANDYLKTLYSYGKGDESVSEAREIDSKKMSAYQKYAKAKRVDDDSIRMAHDNPNHPETKRMMKNKFFATALKMYKAAGKR